jgi:hypothetical protein
MAIARSWDMVLWGQCSAKCELVRVEDLRNRHRAYDKYRLTAVAIALLDVWTEVATSEVQNTKLAEYTCIWPERARQRTIYEGSPALRALSRSPGHGRL